MKHLFAYIFLISALTPAASAGEVIPFCEFAGDSATYKANKESYLNELRNVQKEISARHESLRPSLGESPEFAAFQRQFSSLQRRQITRLNEIVKSYDQMCRRYQAEAEKIPAAQGSDQEALTDNAEALYASLMGSFQFLLSENTLIWDAYKKHLKEERESLPALAKAAPAGHKDLFDKIYPVLLASPRGGEWASMKKDQSTIFGRLLKVQWDSREFLAEKLGQSAKAKSASGARKRGYGK